jgi:hypothetical protein
MGFAKTLSGAFTGSLAKRVEQIVIALIVISFKNTCLLFICRSPFKFETGIALFRIKIKLSLSKDAKSS